MQSSFPDRLDLDLIDSTQKTNPPQNLLLRSLFAFRRLLLFVIRIFRRRPDCVLLFLSIGGSVFEKGLMAWYARLLGIPVFMFPRGGALIDLCEQSAFTRQWTRVAFRGARKVLCQGTTWQNFAVNVLEFSIDDAVIVPSWTATPALIDIGRRRAPCSSLSPVRFLFLGWVEREKGIHELIEACRQISETDRFFLNIAGKGTAEHEVLESITRFGLQDSVKLCGWADEARVHQLLSAADVLVLPSYAEGLPNAMIEAMAARVVVVVSAVGNIPDFINDSQNGILIPPGNSSQLAAAMKRLIDDRDLLSRLAVAGHKTACEVFSVEPAAEKLAMLAYQALSASQRHVD
jgi:glycosyltransferase involved in cell wall biosynthesis